MSAVEEKSAAAPAEEQKTDDKPAVAATPEATKATESETPKSEAASAEAKPEGGETAAAATPAADGEKKDDLSFKRLTGAARNRFRWFVKNGYERDEAAKLAEDPEKIKEIKEQRGLNANGKRPANGSGNGPASKQAKVAGPIRMVVATEKHPGEKLTNDQVNQIKSQILKQVVLQKDTIDVKPHFEDCSFVDGYLLVQCSDGPTVTWLQEVLPKLELWENANVKVSSEKSMQGAVIYVGVFADSLQDSDKDILSFVESQNEGIAASSWTILGRKENKPKKEVELILTMDATSGKQVFKQKFELNYKFSKVTLSKKKRIAGPPQQKNNANNNNNRGNNMNRTNFQGGQGGRRIYNAAQSFVPIWDNNLRFNNNRQGGVGFNANGGGFKAQGPRNDSNFRNQRPNNGNGNAFGLGGNGPRGNQRAGGGGGNNRQPRSLIDQLMQTVNSASNGNMGQRRGPNNGPAFNGGNAGGRYRNNRNNQSRAPRPGFF